MRESELRAALDRAVYREGARLSVRTRRRILALAERHELDVWVCEACGETSEEALACYDVRRRTRAGSGSQPVLCAACAERIPHGRVLSD